MALLLNVSLWARRQQQLLRNAGSWLGFLGTFWADTCRLTLTDWLCLWETTKGCEPASVGACDYICLSMRLCDKSTDVCQINSAFLSINMTGCLSLTARHRRFPSVYILLLIQNSKRKIRGHWPTLVNIQTVHTHQKTQLCAVTVVPVKGCEDLWEAVLEVRQMGKNGKVRVRLRLH